MKPPRDRPVDVCGEGSALARRTGVKPIRPVPTSIKYERPYRNFYEEEEPLRQPNVEIARSRKDSSDGCAHAHCSTMASTNALVHGYSCETIELPWLIA